MNKSPLVWNLDNQPPVIGRNTPGPNNMLNTIKAEMVCKIVSKTLHDLAVRYSEGAVSEEDFVTSLLLLEEEHVTPFGLILTATNTIDDWTHFALKIAETRQICAAFEFNPETGVFRRSQFSCEEPWACEGRSQSAPD
ncbi:MAG TPA: hypothetical protein VF614_16245 [Chthoniobacteraceae bacterium]